MVMLSDPFETLFRLQQSLDSFRGSDWLESSISGVGPYPPLNVFRKGDDFVVVTELPGLKKSDIEVQVHDKTIRIAGVKSVEYGEGVGLHRREREAGKFDRVVTLPVAVAGDKVKAEYRDGVLAVFLPRAESDKPHSIAIG